MKKVFLILLIILSISFFWSVKLPSVGAEEAKTFIGVIESLRPVMGRPPKWYSARFTALADNGEKLEIWILGASGAAPTSVTDFDGKPMEKTGYNHRPKVGKKVEVKYLMAENGRNDAMSVRYVPLDYAGQPSLSTLSQSAPSAAVASEAGNNIFIGKVAKGGVTFSLRCPYRFKIVTDNGETKDIWVPRDNLRITDINGKSVYGAPPRKNKKMEVKYLIGDNGQYEAVSMRYVPLDYVPQPAAATVPEKTIPESQRANDATGDTFTGTIQSFPHAPHFRSGPPLWPFGMIVVAADNGETNNFLIVGSGPHATAFYGADGKTGTVQDIKVEIGKKVEVKYAVTAETKGYANKQLAVSVRYVTD